MKMNLKKSLFSIVQGHFFRSAKKFCTCVFLVLFVASALGEESDEFHYLPGEGGFPEESIPAWRKAGTRPALIENDRLSVELRDNQILFWMLGRKGDEELGEVSAWDLNKTGEGTVTFQLKCHSDTPDANVFSFAVAGERGLAWVNFYNDHISFGPGENQTVAHDCENEDVYRMAVSNGKFSLYSKRGGLLVDQVAMQGGTTNWNLLWFGSTYPFGEKPVEDKTCLRQWEVGFIKWNPHAAVFEGPEGK